MARPGSESALPFPPFTSFTNFLDDLNALEVLPNELNNQVYSSSYSGSAKYQITRAFRYFELIDEKQKFKVENLQSLLNPDTRQAAMSTMLREKYKSLIELPLETAGPAEVNGWFNSMGMDAATTGKAKSFFLAAAQKSGIKLHSLVADRPLGKGSTVRRRFKTARSRREPSDETVVGTPPPPQDPVVVFHPSIDAFLREARKVTEGANWTESTRKFVLDGFTSQLDLFLPVKKSKGLAKTEPSTVE